MSTETDFAKFVEPLHLRHFAPDEFLIRNTREGVKNSLPPKDLWTNIVQTLLVIDEIREIAGAPIVIHSAYRSPEYNKAVGGERNSFHMRFMALDFSSPKRTPKELQKIAKSLRGKKFAGRIFRGGIGLYPSFLHVDCRATEANW